jgi:type IV pilus assembly protein PilB
MPIFGRGGKHAARGNEDEEPRTGTVDLSDELDKTGEETVKPVTLSEEEKRKARSLSTEEIAANLGLQYIPKLDEYSTDDDALAFVTPELCRRYTAAPVTVDRDAGTLAIVMSDPRDVSAIADFEQVSGMRVITMAADADDISSLINRKFRNDSDIAQLTEELSEAANAGDADAGNPAFVEDQSSPIIQFVNKIIDQAINDRASDIHVEPREKELAIRYRVDGVLHEVQTIPKTMMNRVLSRIKIMANLNIAERRRPQDGRIRVRHGDTMVDLRVAVLPTIYGEKITMRILNAPVGALTLTDLNMLPDNLKAFTKGFRRPFGMVLVTGPTGSGKSTTLYTTLNAVANENVNVITVEDPVEYRIDGINQVQITKSKTGDEDILSFADALRSILRSDPDIILVGEIRDSETAKIAIEAALTGHLVLSTLHTNDAPSAATRLIEMGVEPFLVAQSLACVVAQRLVRRLCRNCKREHTLTEEEFKALQLPGDYEPVRIYEPVGCEDCGGTGYRGRLAIHEVMLMDGELEKLTANDATTDDIAKAAARNGMVRLRRDCWAKVLSGDTSVAEVLHATTAD